MNDGETINRYECTDGRYVLASDVEALSDLLEACKQVLLDLDGRSIPVKSERIEQLRAAIENATL